MTPEQRVAQLVPMFDRLANDSSRWVKSAALLSLGTKKGERKEESRKRKKVKKENQREKNCKKKEEKGKEKHVKLLRKKKRRKNMHFGREGNKKRNFFC